MKQSSLYRSASRAVRSVDYLQAILYARHMKRTNLVLDEQILEETLRISGERTYSAAVGRALTDFVRRAKAGRILELAGSGLWEGDLGKMRRDRKAERGKRVSG